MFDRVGIMIGNVLHRHCPAKRLLQTGPSTRVGGDVFLLEVDMSAVMLLIQCQQPVGNVKLRCKMVGLYLVCNVCRIVLCKNYIWDVYDHRKGGTVYPVT